MNHGRSGSTRGSLLEARLAALGVVAFTQAVNGCGTHVKIQAHSQVTIVFNTGEGIGLSLAAFFLAAFFLAAFFLYGKFTAIEFAHVWGLAFFETILPALLRRQGWFAAFFLAAFFLAAFF